MLPLLRHGARLLAAAALCWPAALSAQDSVTVEPELQPAVPAAVRIFLDCQSGGCDFDYLRTEIPWVDYVRDRADADLHVLVTRITTGSGGQQYTLHVRGLERLARVDDTLRFASRPGQAGAEVRAELARTLAIGLVRFAIGTPQAQGLRIDYVAPAATARSAAVVTDPWNAWVFRVGGGGSFNEEERRKDRRFNGSVSARRVTEAWKIGTSASTNVIRDTYVLSDRTERSVRESYNAGGVVIRSLGSHWGAGAQLSVGSSTFSNHELAVRMAPAVEYSLFPYAEATRRQLTVQYSLGASHFQYAEETIFERLEETLPSHAMVVGYDVQQPWGSSEATLVWSNYLNDFAKNRLNLSGRVNLRLFRGLEFNVGGSASMVRDQLSIPRADATEEDVLLQRRALLSNYRVSGNVGFAYTFGSIFNSVVNPRFGSGTGDILR